MDWLTPDIWLLLATAASIGCVHTILGPDHYLPFVALARDRGWTRARTLRIALVCGIGHCAGSVLLGIIGIAVGLGLAGLETTEANRGNIAAWLLLGFALAYLVFSLRAWRRTKTHCHIHHHADGTVHTHPHASAGEHLHAHAPATATPLIAALFVIFVLGPCEALIPMLMYPAASVNFAGVIAVTLTFSFVTVATMLSLIWLALTGAQRFSIKLAPGVSGIVTASLIGGCAAAMLLGL